MRETSVYETIECSECCEKCPITPIIRKHPETGELFGVYVCPYDEDIGRITVDLNRRRRWEIVQEKLAVNRTEQPGLSVPAKKGKKRPTQRKIADRNRSVALTVMQWTEKYGRLPTVDEVIAETSFSRKQIYATNSYKECRIAKKSTKATTETVGPSIASSEYFGEKSTQHTRAKKRTKADQDQLDAIIEKQLEDDNSRYVQ